MRRIGPLKCQQADEEVANSAGVTSSYCVLILLMLLYKDVGCFNNR